MITCRDLIRFLIDYTSGELPPTERAEFDRHLAVCPPCVAYLKTYEQTIRLGKAAMADGDDDLPAEMPEELVRAILASRSKR